MNTADKQTTSSLVRPHFDFAEMLRQFSLPGVALDQVIEQGRKNIKAVQQANQAVVDGWQAIAEKQADVFRGSMKPLQKAVFRPPV